MKAALVFTPFFISYQPYSSLPSLGAILRESGHQVSLCDENIEFINHYLSPSHFRHIYQKTSEAKYQLQKQANPSKNEFLLGNYIDKCFPKIYFDRVINDLEVSIGILRDRQTLSNELKANKARDVLIKAQNILNQFIRFNQIYRSQNETMSFDLSWRNIETELRADTTYRTYFQNFTVPKMATIKPDLVGISIIFEEQIVPAFILADEIRNVSALSNVHITLGGPVITILQDVIKQHRQVFDFMDSCIVHEGEIALLKLMQNLELKTGFSDVPNLIYLQNEKVVSNDVEMIEDLDSLPTPDFDGLPLEKYYSPNLVPVLKPTRGCYWNRCAFCNNRYLNNNTIFRTRKPEKVFEDLVKLNHKYGVEEFTLWEEAAVPKSLRKLSGLIEKSGHNFKWFAEARLDKVYSEEYFKTLYRGGCRGMVFGLESGNERIQGLMNKGYDLAICKKIIKACSKSKIRVYITLMIGFPTETFQEALETIDFVSDHNRYIFHAGVSHFGLRKYTDTYHRPARYGIRITSSNGSFSSIGDLNYGIDNSGMTQSESMTAYNMVTRKLGELGLTRNEPECHYLIRANAKAGSRTLVN